MKQASPASKVFKHWFAWTVVFVVIVTLTWLLYPLAFFKCLLQLVIFQKFQIKIFIQFMKMDRRMATVYLNSSYLKISDFIIIIQLITITIHCMWLVQTNLLIFVFFTLELYILRFLSAVFCSWLAFVFTLLSVLNTSDIINFQQSLAFIVNVFQKSKHLLRTTFAIFEWRTDVNKNFKFWNWLKTKWYHDWQIKIQGILCCFL